ncbi:MAG: BPSS1780 family membrane protein [Burkholderiales bacterium]
MTQQPVQIRRTAATQGWRWIVGGFAIFRANPLMWFAFVLTLFLLVQLVAYVPFFGAVLMLLYPVLIAGLMSGCHDVENGRPLQATHLIAGFWRDPLQLCTLGAIYLIGQILTMWLMVAIGGEELLILLEGDPDRLDADVVASAFGKLMLALLVGTLVSLPLLMAIWFSPLAVAFGKLRALPAMKASIIACWKNMLPLFVYGLVLLALMVVAMIPFGLAAGQANPGIWFVMPFVLPSVYVSYRDIFRAAD